MNSPQVGESLDEIARFHFRSFDVVPPRNRILVERVRHSVAPPPLHKSGNDLHIEDPSRQKRRCENVAKCFTGSEELRAALGIVNCQAEGRGNERGTDAAEVVAGGTTADFATEESYARAENDDS